MLLCAQKTFYVGISDNPATGNSDPGRRYWVFRSDEFCDYRQDRYVDFERLFDPFRTHYTYRLPIYLCSAEYFRY